MKYRFEKPSLGHMTGAQRRKLSEVGARFFGISDIGVAKAITDKLIFLISRDGNVQYKGRRGQVRYK